MSAPELALGGADAFGPVANPDAYVPTEASQRAQTSVEAVLAQGRDAALVGPPGLGKTLLLRRLALADTRLWRSVYVPFCSLAPDEFFALVLSLLGADSHVAAPAEELLTLARDVARQGQQLLLCVDDIGSMPEETAEALAARVAEAGGALRVLLAAVEGLEARRVCRLFAASLDIVRLTAGMSADEARRYVESRLAAVGSRPRVVAAFDEETIAELYRISEGVPRRLNLAAQEIVRRQFSDALPRLGAPPPPSPAPVEPTTESDLPAPPPERPTILDPAQPDTPSRPAAAPAASPPVEAAGEYRLVRGRFVDPQTGLPIQEGSRRGEGVSPETRAEDPGAPVSASRAAAAASTGTAGLVSEVSGVSTSPPASRARLRWAGLVAFALGLGLAVLWAQPRSGGLDPEPAPSAAEISGPAAPEAVVPVVRESAPEPEPTAALAPRPDPPAAADPETEAPVVPEREPVVAAVPEPAAERPQLPETGTPAGPIVGATPAPQPEPEPVVSPAETARTAPVAPGPAAAPPQPAPAPPKPTAATPAFVAVAINATPWAVIEVDGRHLGETPLAGVAIEAGRHTFRATMPDGSVREQTLEIGRNNRRVVFE